MTAIQDLLALESLSYDVIVTAETIYSHASTPRLYAAVKALLQRPHGVAYVAAKTYYFGVGGGTREFEQLVARDRTFQSEV